MPSRIIRAEILDSDRWLGLAHVSERMAYIVLLLSADDLGTLDAGLGSLSRKWREPCQIKGTEDAAKILQALMDADLVRTYQAGGNTYAFLPRFHPRFRATTFRRPPPPLECLHGEPSVSANILLIQTKDSKNDRQKTVSRRSSVVNMLSSAPDVDVDVDVSSDVDVEKRTSTTKSSKLDDAKLILDFLNNATERKYRPVDSNLKPIAARIAETSVEHCKAVICDRVAKWKHDPKMDEYLRPATLFGAQKFHQYLPDAEKAFFNSPEET